VHWFQVIATILYAVGLVGCAGLAWLSMTGRFARAQAVQGSMAVALAAFVVGLILASQIVPVADLTRVLVVYLPYFFVAAWFLYFAQLLARDWDLRKAGIRALLLAMPTLLLSPLALGFLFVLVPPR
jgi:hypothetical protein